MGEEHEQAFSEIKQIISKEVMLSFPDFDKKFTLYTDASALQLGAVIMQEDKPIAFYSRKLTETQKKYGVGEIELLSVVETLKEFRSILLGQQIEVYTDHLNNVHLTPNNKLGFNRIQRWRWLLEEFGPEFKYLPGERNRTADALSRIERMDDEITSTGQVFAHVLSQIDSNQVDSVEDNVYEILQSVDYHEVQSTEQMFPLDLKLIKLRQAEEDKCDRNGQPAHYGHRDGFVTYNDKIYVPKSLRKQILSWYHEMLCHPGTNRMVQTIQHGLNWPSLVTDTKLFVATCRSCQLGKKRRHKYGLLPMSESILKPWHTLCVDCIGPYTITDAAGKEYILNALTMADPASGLFEIVELPNKQAHTTAILLDRTWFSRYPRPMQITYDNGKEFLGKEFQEMIQSFGIDPAPTTVKNPQANFVERIHLTLGNMLRTMMLEEIVLDPEDPWSGILSKLTWAIRSTTHSSLNATPGQIAFGRDMLYDLAFTVNWNDLKGKKLQRRRANNEQENRRRIKYNFKINDEVMLERNTLQRKMNPLRDGPFTITKVYTNGTVRIQRGIVSERVNIRRISPYLSSDVHA